MKSKLDIDNWKRKEHFEFFKKFDEPFYDLSMNVECTEGFEKVGANGHSVFACYLFNAMKASNAVEQFRYRMENHFCRCQYMFIMGLLMEFMLRNLLRPLVGF